MTIGKVKWLALGAALAVVAPLAAQAQDDTSAVATAVAIVRPSVVAIETRFETPVIEDEYEYWHALRGARPLYGLWGSGFVYKDPNYVVTTAFLMEKAEHIRVILDDGRSYKATLVGKNDDLEVAVLKVDWGPDMEPISPPIGNSEALKLGQPIAIVGKALNSVDTYTSFGVVSAIRKQVPGTEMPTDEFLQFDASYELSFVGGPMVDVRGNVVGMVDRTVQDFSLTNINLAVPINEVIYAADRIIAGENLEVWLGIERTTMSPRIIEMGLAPRTHDWNQDGKPEAFEFGMFVTHVEPLSPADIAGITQGDVIVEMDGKLMKYEYDWDSFVRDLNIGQLVNVRFLRKSGDGAFTRMETQLQVLQAAEDEDEEGEDGSGDGDGGSSYHSAGRNSGAIFAPGKRN